MASKTITISEEVYNELKKLKSRGESFSTVIHKLINKKQKGIASLLDFLSTQQDTDPSLLIDLAESTEKVIEQRKQTKWRVSDL